MHPCCRNIMHPCCRNKMHPCCRNKMHPFYRNKMHPCLYYWYRGICWKLNVVWHCKSHLGMEKRRRWPPCRPPPSAATKIPSDCDLLMFPKDRWDLLSLIVDVWNITWSRRYLITIFAEHCVKIHDSWYFPGILDHVSNIDIDIDINKFSQCDLF